MDEAVAETAPARRNWAQLATRIAVALSIGAVVVALIASLGSGQGAWGFRGAFGVLRYAFYTAIAGAVVAVIALLLARRHNEKGLVWANVAALVVGLGFVLYLGMQVSTARSVPAIHDISTNLDDIPQFSALSVRADNLENVPDMDRPELAAMEPEARWKAIHREAYGNIETVRVSSSVADTIRRAEALARERGWEIARVDTAAGTLEATDTSLFFRFKDDVVVRARPGPDGNGSLVDMRSISRVGGSDVGVNAKRVRGFLEDLEG